LGDKLLGTSSKNAEQSDSTATTTKADKAKEAVGAVLNLLKKKN
jgi:hypothetical protein